MSVEVRTFRALDKATPAGRKFLAMACATSNSASVGPFYGATEKAARAAADAFVAAERAKAAKPVAKGERAPRFHPIAQEQP